MKLCHAVNALNIKDIVRQTHEDIFEKGNAMFLKSLSGTSYLTQRGGGCPGFLSKGFMS